MTAPIAPSSALFGTELADKIAKTKSIQKQCILGLAQFSKVVTLPPVVNGDTPIDVLKKTNTAIEAACVAGSVAFTLPSFGFTQKAVGSQQCVVVAPAASVSVAAKLILKSSAPANLITLTSKNIGEEGNAYTVAVAVGTASGKKITIVSNIGGSEVFDNLADVPAAVAAINNATTGSKVITATQITTGTLVDISATNLAGGVDGKDASVINYDGALDAANKIAVALYEAIRLKGYII